MTRPAPALASNRRIIGLAVAALGALIVEPLYVLVDTAIVGRLGTAELGGLALSATVLSLVVSACTFLIYGTTERVARYAQNTSANHTNVLVTPLTRVFSSRRRKTA